MTSTSRPAAVLATLVAASLLAPAAGAARSPDASLLASQRQPAPVGSARGVGSSGHGGRVSSVAASTITSRPSVPERGGQGDQAWPGIHYRDALAHLKDRPVFVPGDAVEVPFRPRADDRWPVAGRLPRALPAGRATGRQLVLQRNGSTWVAPETASRGRRPPPRGTRPGGTEPRAVEASRAPAAAPGGGAIDATVSGGSDLLNAAGRVATTTDTSSSDPSARVGVSLRREVFGFLPYWELGDSSTRLDYAALSTIAYFGVGATRTGQLLKRNSDGTPTTGWAGWTSSRMTSIINEAHRTGTRVVLTVQRFSWSSSQAAETVALLSSSSARQALANEIAAAVRDRGADGVNLDFEPIPSGQGTNFVTFVRQVRAALNARAPGYQLTFDATGRIGNYDVAALTAAGAADAVLVMGYDYRTAGSGYAGSIAPLTGPAYDVSDTLRVFLARTSPGKVILGVPYYGRAWSTVSNALNAATLPQGSTYGYSTTAVYTTAVEFAAAHGRRYDSVEQTAWTAYQRRNCSSCPLAWRQLYYDDVRGLAAKYDLVNFNALRGAGIWALGYDGTRTELYSLLKAKFVDDRTPPSAGIRAMAPVSREEGIYVDWIAVDDYTGVAAYDVQVSKDGGAWAAWLTGTRAGAGTYLAESGHGYAFRVRARDGKGNWSPWNVSAAWTATPRLAVGGFGRVTAATLTMRSRPSTSAEGVGTLTTNDLVAVTDGPRSAEGYTWYQVTAPLREWAPVGWSAQRGVWVAGGTGTSSYLVAAQAPNATKVDAYISRVATGAVHTASLTGSSSTAPPPTRPDAFSPNGDGVLDALRVTYRLASSLESLSLRIYRLSDRTFLGERPLPGTAAGDHAYDWDGRLGGTLVGDGTLLLQISGVRDGVRYSWPASRMGDPVLNVAPLRATVDTTPPTFAAVAAAPRPFSPNGDGVKDTVNIRASAFGAARWTITARGASGAVRSFAGGGATISATWDGRNAQGARVPDGAYAVFLTAVDALGNARSVGLWVGLDTVPPRGSVRVVVPGLPVGATGNSFSPDGDRSADVANLAWTFSERSGGTLQVRNGGGAVWWGRIGYSAAGHLTWNGRDSAGRTVADGTYGLFASVVDAAGNRSGFSGTVILNRTAGYLQGPWLFYPSDRDALATSGVFSFRLTRMAYTTLRVWQGGVVVRTAWYGWGRAAGSYAWTWDGRDDQGRHVPEGWYKVQLVAYRDGLTQILERRLVSRAFAIYPSASTLRPGDLLTVLARSAEPLRSPPMATFGQSGLAPRTATMVLQPDGRWKGSFVVASGGTGPATITVAGTDSRGGRNAYTQLVTVR